MLVFPNFSVERVLTQGSNNAKRGWKQEIYEH